MARYDTCRWTGDLEGVPTLHLDDVSKIPFVKDVSGVEEYQHRARVRADTGDLFVAVTRQSDGYEEYCRSRLGLGSPEFLLAEAGDHSYAVASACMSNAILEQISHRARRAGGLLIHPYMAIHDVWDIAAGVAESSGVGVEVIGPPPPVLWVANDKSALSEIVSSVLSPEWIVETYPATDPTRMAEHLGRLARNSAKVGMKRARCASGLGNAVFGAERLRQLGPEGLLAEVEAFLSRTEWPGDEEVLVVAWEETDCSPSSQTWIPPVGGGPPIVQGVYEQLLEGENKVFVGSRPSTLPDAANRAIKSASLRVAEALQSVGYVGRCSFDLILLGDPDGEFSLKFTECNGRWGGTSTPMHLVDRIVGGPRPTYWAQDYVHQGLVGVHFRDVLDRLGDAVFDVTTGRGRYILYNVGPLADHGKLDVIAFGETPERAESAVREDLSRLLGLESG
jgi:hypothetical protein